MERFAVRVEPPGLGAPLRTIYCVGRNYAEHAKELGNAVPAEPLIFLKPAASALFSGGTLRLPAGSKRVDHEVEVVAGIGTGGAVRWAIGIDFTARDWQDEAKKAGMPWTRAKSQRGFAALGPFVEAQPPFHFSLAVNGAARQRGSTGDMVHAVDTLLSYIDAQYGLGPGDVVFTGTPAGVAPLAAGDKIEAILGANLSRLELTVA